MPLEQAYLVPHEYAAGTEIVYRLGMSDVLVGRSHECDYPTAAMQVYFFDITQIPVSVYMVNFVK